MSHTITDHRKSDGWLAQLELEIAGKEGKSVVSRSRQNGPLTIQSPFYPEGDICHLYLLHPPAGIVGGDHLQLALSVVEAGSCLLTTPGATKFYRSNGKVAHQQQHFTIKAGCCLEWLPQETIYFPDANAQLSTSIHLEDKAHFLGWDIHCLGLPVNDLDFGAGKARMAMQVYRNDEPLFIDTMLVSEEKKNYQAAFLRDQQITGTLIATGADETLLETLREGLPKAEFGECAATLLDDLLLVRYLGSSTNEARKLFLYVWQQVRPHIVKRDATVPRIWAT